MLLQTELFPAYAGVNLRECDDRHLHTAIPRVCGGEPNYWEYESGALFPAYAGVNLEYVYADSVPTIPRVCGG